MMLQCRFRSHGLYIALMILIHEEIDLCQGIKTIELSKIRHLLWTRSNPDTQDDYNLLPKNHTNLNASPFNGSLPTYILFPDYMNVAKRKWIQLTKLALLDFHESNFICVDWMPLVNDDWATAAENSPDIARYTAGLIDWLIAETDLQSSQVHIMGHSLGAHAAGLTGKYVTLGQIGRITGLDPAGPLYGENAKFKADRLDKSHAAYVDILHTNGCPSGCSFGLIAPMGHADFYVNGGCEQPQCLPSPTDSGHADELTLTVKNAFNKDIMAYFTQDCIKNFILGSTVNNLMKLNAMSAYKTAFCGHDIQVIHFWLESIKALSPQNMFTAWPCPNRTYYDLGKCSSCGDGCPHMGFHVEKNLTGIFHLSTNAEPPFAKGDHH